MRHPYRAGAAAAAIVAGLMGAGPALAQQDPAMAEAGTQGDIIVTATRRAQALQDVPIAVSALTGEQLANSGVTDIRTLNQLAPSLLVSGATSEVNFSARIRGVGTVGENAGIESSVALFIDGVYRSRTGTGLTDLGEVERVEVLRGPQGTLFGRNASAGLINVVTRQPEFTTGGYAAATYGNFDNIRLEGGVNLALSNAAAAKLEGLWHQRDGFVEDIRSGRRFNDRDRWMVRGQFRFEPTDDISIRLIGDYSQRREQCCVGSFGPAVAWGRDASGNTRLVPNTLDPLLRALGVTSPRGELFRVAVSPNRDFRADADDWGVSGEVNWNLGAATLTSITAYRDYRNSQGQDADFTDIDIWGRSDLRREFKTFSQEARLQGTVFNDRVDWLIGGYFSDERLFVSDNLRFGADAARYGNCLVAAASFPQFLNPLSPTCLNPNPVFPGYDALADALGVARLAGTGLGDGGFFRQSSRSLAFFTHNVIDLIPDTLQLTLGARYTDELKKLDSVFNQTNTLCAALRQAASGAAGFPCAINGTAGPGFRQGAPGTRFAEGKWTGTVVLSFKPSPDWLVYGSWARGYKAGGFNLDTSAVDIVCNPNAGTAAQQAECQRQLALPANTVGNARPEAIDLQFAAETVDNFEVGVKFSRSGFTANAALFFSEFSDFQLNTFNGVNFEVTNVQACRDSLGGADTDPSPLTGACPADRLRPGVTARGFELELSARPAPDLSFTGGLTYTDTSYRRDLVGTNGRPLSPVLFQLPGRRLSNAPAYVVSGSASWTPPLGDQGLRGLLYLDYRLTSSYNTGSDLDVEKIQDSFVILNGRVGVMGDQRRWSIELWGQNLLNKQFFQIGSDAPLQGAGTFRAVADGRIAQSNQLFLTFPGEPRTFGITGRVRF